MSSLSQQTTVLKGKSYHLFINSLKSEFTKKNYQSALTRFLNYFNITTETLANMTAKDDLF
jgi:hypothetical protein